MEITKLPLDQIKLYPRNPRKNNQAVEAVAESIRQCGYIAPIIVDEDGTILAGHTRYMALRELGWEEANVLVMSGLTDDQKRKYRLLDNKTNELADWDMPLLADELLGLDFGELDLDWGLDAAGKSIDLDADPVRDEEDEAVHCPKCGFIFRP